MQQTSVHEIELYPLRTFKALLDHEVNRSRRYGDSLTLVDLVVETEPVSPEAQHSAEVLAINALNVHLRETDIPCKQGNEFLVLMPLTSGPGARTACERLRKLMMAEYQSDDPVSFQLFIFIGMATLPIDRSVTSDGLAQNAAEALQYARTNLIASVVAFSDIKK
jgi:hypothetical protein